MDLEFTLDLARTRLILLVSMTISAATLFGVSRVVFEHGIHPDAGTATVADAVAAETARLREKSPNLESTSARASRVRNAISHGDYAAARQISTAELAQSRLQAWRFYPFAEFMSNMSNLADPGVEARLNDWVVQDPNDAIPLLIRAQYHYDVGWFARSNNHAAPTSADRTAMFGTNMKKALADVNAAIGLSDGNPYAYYLRLEILRGLGMASEMSKAFEQGIAKYPGYYSLYDSFLAALEPRSGGSVLAMYSFVDRYAGHVPEQSPLNLLYLDLYARLLTAASLGCTGDTGVAPTSQCVASMMGKLVAPLLEKRLPVALQLYDHADQRQFDVAIGELLDRMMAVEGADNYSAAMLQLAAGAMHSDAQLNAAPAGQNDYVIDRAMATSWYLRKSYDNALTKAHAALADIERTPFPDEEQRDLAIAGIYGLVAGIYDNLNQFVPMIAYEKAYLSLSGTSVNGQLICYGYYKLKDLSDGLSDCGRTVDDGTGGPRARYWRGLMYQGLGQPAAAVADFRAVADSSDGYRGTAAIAASMTYFKSNDNRGALEVLTSYPWLYDPRLAGNDTTAVAYNNRCYAYMVLGELQKALDDCTQSLRYGNLPDARSKQQLLLQRLAAQKAAR